MFLFLPKNRIQRYVTFYFFAIFDISFHIRRAISFLKKLSKRKILFYLIKTGMESQSMYLFVTNIFVFFILVLLKKFKFDIVLAKNDGGKNVALLNPPQLQSLQNKSLKKKCCETTFFPCYPVFYISNFPPLPYPLKCPPIYYSNDPLRTFRRNQNAKFKICE